MKGHDDSSSKILYCLPPSAATTHSLDWSFSQRYLTKSRLDCQRSSAEEDHEEPFGLSESASRWDCQRSSAEEDREEPFGLSESASAEEDHEEPFRFSDSEHSGSGTLDLSASLPPCLLLQNAITGELISHHHHHHHHYQQPPKDSPRQTANHKPLPPHTHAH